MTDDWIVVVLRACGTSEQVLAVGAEAQRKASGVERRVLVRRVREGFGLLKL